MSGQVNVERLRALLDEQGESEHLDYKATCDLTSKRDCAQIARHIGAMAVKGGHIIIGAGNSGGPSGSFDSKKAKLFDEAKLRPKLQKFFSDGLSFQTAEHELEGSTYVIIRVEPHPDGFCAFHEDGAYEEGDKTKFAFRKGQVYARHGTSSEPCNQADLLGIIERKVEEAKESLRAEHTDQLAEVLKKAQAQQTLATAPASTLSWRMDEDTFVATIIEQVRRDDPIPLRLLLRRMEGDAARLVSEGEEAELETLLDRLACLAANFVLLETDELFKQVVRALVSIYNLGFDARGMTQSGKPITSARLWLLVIERVMAVGSVLVREERWEVARDLTLQRGKGYEFTETTMPYVTWIRHATTEASRGGQLTQVVEDKRVDKSLLWMVQELVQRSECLRQGLAADDERILDSLCQFDMLAMVTTLAEAARIGDVNPSALRWSHHYYPHFARFFEHRSLPMLERVITDQVVREQVFPGRSDDELAGVIRWVDHTATQEAFRYSGWDGMLSGRVAHFLEQHPE